VSPSSEEGESAALSEVPDAARKRAAVETFARYEQALLRTAQRYSLCADDADDALQRGLEILLTKAPNDDPRELIRWTQTVVKHEALAVRRERERILAGPAAANDAGREDWVALIPTEADGPPERAERREAIARSREALQALKPQELRALSLLAEGYSYVEIGKLTGFSQTKVNRCLAEGRERFRSLLSRSQDGARCEEMRPLISAFCDGEARRSDAAQLREHLHACASCRATLRAYRAAPRAAAALAPTLPGARSLLDRLHDAWGAVSSRLGGGTAESALSQAAAGGGSRGAGIAALAKAAAICVGTAGGAAACAATGVIPATLGLERGPVKPAIEHRVDPMPEAAPSGESGIEYETAPSPAPEAAPPTHPDHPEQPPAPDPAESASAEASGALEYAPQPAPVPSAEAAGAGSSSADSAAGEFGP
jgi:RNA polymerase sigma factor (sigma-70 family)